MTGDAARDAGARAAGSSIAAQIRAAATHLDAGLLQEAEAACRAVIALDAQNADALHMLGAVAVRAGRPELAVQLIGDALRSKPDNEYFLVSLGGAQMALGRPDQAMASYSRAIALNPAIVDAHVNLGNLLSAHGLPQEALQSYRRALKLQPAYAEVHYNIANTLGVLDRIRESIESYRRAIDCKPGFAPAHNNLGRLLRRAGHMDEALACFRRAITLDPAYPEAHNNLGNALSGRRQMDEAAASYRRALMLRPEYAEAHANLANTLRDLGRLDEAGAHCRHALAANPALVEAHMELGGTLMDLGLLDAAETAFRRALEIRPDLVEARSTLLAAMNYSTHTPQDCLTEAQCYGAQVAAQAVEKYTAWDVSPAPARLRIGFVSGDLREHVVSYFLEQVLNYLDPAVVELYAYPTIDVFDELSARIKPLFAAWKSLAGLSDEAAARMMHADGLHILCDLAGHTTYSRLPLFAYKPAPVQLSWLGYFATTGVAEIDYFIADPWTLPPGEEAHFSEQIWRLPETRLCFTAPNFDVPVSALPALTNGYVTFGCFNNLTKLNDAVIALWARVLAAVPHSRLYLKAKQLKEAPVRERVIARFVAQGVDAGRLLVEGPGSRAEYLAAYQRVDITLDPFPFTGGTTSAESLWMAVPVLTLAGRRLVSRQGVGLLMNAGLSEWIATDADDYVRRAVAHAGNPAQLAQLRRGLRQQVLASPVFDASRFARHLEAAWFGMWQKRQAGLEAHAGAAAEPLATSLPLEERPVPAREEKAAVIALFQQGRHAEAAALASTLTEKYPHDAFGWKSRGATLKKLGRMEEAFDATQSAVLRAPGDHQAQFNLGVIARELSRFATAETAYRHAVALNADDAAAHAGLAVVLHDLGRIDEAEAAYRRALQIIPDDLDTFSNLLLLMNYSQQPGQRYAEEARRYGRLAAAGAGRPFTQWQALPSPARLRIGLVSGDLREHAVSYFLEQVLVHLDRSAVELYAYCTADLFDGVSARLKPLFAAWQSIAGVSDEAAARMIHDDGVHILCDLSGHTTYNRLPVFAWKPAPVQLSWPGYFATTGVAAIDYFIADPWTLPPGAEADYSETIWRLPETRLCFTAPEFDVPVSGLPALVNGYLTFGCFNDLTKLNDAVVALWAAVLAAVPNSRLHLKAKQFKDPAVRAWMVARFKACGVSAERLIVDAPVPRAEYLAAYQRVDITLDPFPFTGGTTSAESLWMGVPVLTLAGQRLVSRQGVGLLANAGLADWIAADAADYVRRAVAHAADLPALARLRGGLREQVLASPVFDAPRFARHLEAAWRTMWLTWRTRTAPAAVAVPALAQAASHFCNVPHG